MIKIFCTVPTSLMLEQANNLNIPIDRVVLLNNIIISRLNNPNYIPSLDEVAKLLKESINEAEANKFAIPYYQLGLIINNETPLVLKNVRGDITVNLADKRIGIEKYLNEVNGLPKEAINDISNFKELYTVLLWKERLKSELLISDKEAYDKSIKLLEEYKKVNPGYFGQLKPYKEVESFLDNTKLSSTHKNELGEIEISIKKNISVLEFFDYVQGKIKSKTSELKAKVLLKMEELGITLNRLKEVLNTPEKIKNFLYNHELNHKMHYQSDVKNYNRQDINASENINIELRCNLYAWESITGEHYDLNTQRFQMNKNIKTPTVFTVSTSTNYPDRTRENVDWSDVTLALVVDNRSKGETLTAQLAGSRNSNELGDRKPVERRKDKYVGVSINDNLNNKVEDIVNTILNTIKIKGLPTTDIKLNIAGNGIYSFGTANQYYLNNLLEQVIKSLGEKGITIASIRSGGQTGIDEAGIIAAQRLGIPSEVHTTSNFAFRTKSGQDIKDNEVAFKNRFMDIHPFGQEGHMTYEDTMKLLSSRKTYSGIITSLQPNQVFVFGSNTEGRHGLGAAKTAKDKFGAIYGQAEGIQGQSYAIITKDLTKDDKKNPSRTKEQIIEQIHKLYEYAKANPNKEFLVAYSSQGKNLNYYTNQEMAEMFTSEPIPSNIVFEEGFDKMINQSATPSRQTNNQPVMTKTSIATQDTTPIKEDLPPIGTPSYDVELKVDKESPRAVLAREMSPSTIFNRENLIARDFSEEIDGLLEETVDELKEKIEEEEDFKVQLKLTEKLNKLTSENGRRELINDLKVDAIKERLKAKYIKWTKKSDEKLALIASSKEKADYIRAEYQKIIDNFDVLFNEAFIIIEENEKIRLAKDKKEETEEDENGEKVHGNEGYTNKIRLAHPKETARAETKRALSDIKQLDSEGNPVLDDLGKPTYYSEEYIHSTMLGYLSKEVVTPDDFSIYDAKKNRFIFPALENMQKQFPWVRQVINKLAYDPNLVSILYTDFRKEFISYWAQFEGKTVPLNTPVEIDSTLNNLIGNYESGRLQDDKSVYNSDLSINKENAKSTLDLLNKIIPDIQRADAEDLQEIAENIVTILKRLGISEQNITKESLTLEENKTLIRNILNYAKEILEKLEDFEGGHYVDTYVSQFKQIAALVGKATELDAKTTFRENKKDYPSYAAPNELEITFKKLKSDNYRSKFLQESFKKYQWFYLEDTENGGGEWMNEMLRLIEEDENIRYNMELKNIFLLDRKEYSDWNRGIISNAFVREYFYAKEDPSQTHQYGYFNFPIFSDTQMATFIKFKKYTGDFKKELVPLYVKLIRQELGRMKLVEERAKKGISAISNFDKKGKKFCFMPELNDKKVLYTTPEGEVKEDLLLNIINDYGESGKKRPEVIEGALVNAVYSVMSENFEKFIKNNKHLVEDESLVSYIRENTRMNEKQTVEEKLEEYLWNQMYMTSQLIQITTTDLAFYKNSVDFQKRFKEVYAAGTRLNTNSKYGRKFENTVYISDDVMTSPTYTPLSAIFKESVKEGKMSKMDYDSTMFKFRDINATDGQAYRSLSSYRAIMDMLGIWNEDLEETFERFNSNTWDMKDINVVMQTIKPFVFGHVDTPSGPDTYIKVPHQNKNSEFLLLATYQMLGTALTKSPQLRGLNKFMEDNNIDVVQFESAVKVGGSGIININVKPSVMKEVFEKRGITVDGTFYSIPKDLEFSNITDTFKEIKKYFDSLLDKGNISNTTYNKIMEEFRTNEQDVIDILTKYTKTKVRPTDVMSEGFNLTSVHRISYESYMIAQPTPEHIFDTESIFGSQFRNLIASDLPEDIEIEVEGVKIKGRDNVKKFYFSLIIENLLESYEEIAKDFKDIEKLQERLLNIVKGNPKYGRDMLNALELVEYNDKKVFNMPMNDMMIAAKFEELLTSVFKNNVTKQYIKGAACILVSNFGFTEELEVKRNEDGSVQCIECYLPATSKTMYEPFLKEIVVNGNVLGYEIDYEKLKDADESLLDFVGYRIPTEGKYSMLPLRIKGFLPQQNGSAIMLPAEVTTLSGSDFDVDKLFMFLPSFTWENKYNISKAWDDFYEDPNNKDIKDEINSNIQKALEHYIKNNPDEDMDFEGYLKFLKDNNVKHYQLSEVIDEESKTTKAQQRFIDWFKTRKGDYFISKKIKRVKYNTERGPQRNNKTQRDNALIQVSLSILRNKEVSLASQHPGNFDTLKNTSRVDEIYTDNYLFDNYKKTYGIKDTREALIHLINNDLDTLTDFINEYKKEDNPLTIDTFIKYHNQNMTGGTLIGIYANNTTMQAKLQGKNLKLKDGYAFNVDGKRIQNLTSVYTEEKVNGKIITKRISQNCAEFSAASVDNVKDPVLASLMQNKDTANIACFMLRAGFSIPQIGVFFNLPSVKDCISKYGNLKPLDAYINNYESNVAELTGLDSYEANTEFDFNTLNMMELTVNMSDSIYMLSLDNDQKAALYERLARYTKGFQQIAKLAEFLNDTVRAYRADSPNGAIGISIAKAKIQTMNVDRLIEMSKRIDYPFDGIEDIMSNDYLSLEDSRDEMREKLMNSEMPLLQAFYSLGIDLGLKTMANYFTSANDAVSNIVSFVQGQSTKSLTEKDVKTIYKAVNLFGLSNTKLFGNDDNMTMEEKRVYYLNTFPTEFANIIANNKDIAELPFIQKLVLDTKQGIVMRDSARNTSYLREVLSNSADSLLYLDNPEAHKLAIGLLRYAYFKEGLSFGSHSFNQFFSTIFKNGFPEYIETLRELNNNMETDRRWNKFLDQLYANNASLATVVDFGGVTELDNGLISIPLKNVVNRNFIDGSVYVYIVSPKGYLYKLNGEKSSEFNIVYKPIERIAYNSYNISSNPDDMSKEFNSYEASYKKKKEQDKKVNSSNGTFNSIDTVSKTGEADEMFANYEEAMGINADFDNYLASMELNYSKEADVLTKPIYSSEDGYKEIDERPCKVTENSDTKVLGSL